MEGIEKRRPRAGFARVALRLSAVAGVALWAVAFFSRPTAVDEGAVVFGPKTRLSGIVHVHTNLSDGRGTPSDVVEAAARAGADFIVITDHNRVDAATLAPLSRAGGPVVLAGSEISTEAGHVLAIGLREPSFRFSGTLSEVLDDIRYLGGCAFVAHPMSPRGEMRFARENEPGSWGVEVVNGDTAWRESSKAGLAYAAWTYPVNSAYALRSTLGTFGNELGLWDRVLAKRFAPAIGGVDAHGRIPLGRSVNVPVPSYESLFGLVRTVVTLDAPLPSDYNGAARAISEGLCHGSSLVAIPSFADPKGFSFAALDASGHSAGSGATIRFEPGIVLQVGGKIPKGTALRILDAGLEVARGADSLKWNVSGPGVYRAEAYVGGSATPWILANPISILTADQERERSRAALMVAAPGIVGTTIIDSFDGPSHFAAEHDPGSKVLEPIIDPAGGRGKGSAARLAFELNSTPKPPVWCALVDRTKRDLSANRGISFWARADGEYRVWFQIRDLNPASADEGTEAWFASIRTSPAWTLYNIPFASLRSINKTTDGTFDPKKIAHIVFVIDHGAMPFGSKGTVWIDDLAAY